MNQQDPASRTVSSGSGPAACFRSRRHGQVPLATLFWRDMIVVGTTVDVAATLAAVLLLALEASTPLAIAVNVAPVPWSVFLFGSVWRATASLRPAAALAWQAGAALWLVLAVLS